MRRRRRCLRCLRLSAGRARCLSRVRCRIRRGDPCMPPRRETGRRNEKMHRERGQKFEESALPESEALVASRLERRIAALPFGPRRAHDRRLRPAQDSGNGDKLIADNDSDLAIANEKLTAIPSPEIARANFGAASRLQSSNKRVITQASSWQCAFERN